MAARALAPPNVPATAPTAPTSAPMVAISAAPPIVAPHSAPEASRAPNCGGTVRLGVLGELIRHELERREEREDPRGEAVSHEGQASMLDVDRSPMSGPAHGRGSHEGTKAGDDTHEECEQQDRHDHLFRRWMQSRHVHRKCLARCSPALQWKRSWCLMAWRIGEM